jgi:hypothetical protein
MGFGDFLFGLGETAEGVKVFFMIVGLLIILPPIFLYGFVKFLMR